MNEQEQLLPTGSEGEINASQGELTAVQTAPEAETGDKTAAFDALIRGEYKQAFDTRVQKILDGRLRQLRQENQRLQRQSDDRAEEEAAQLARLYEQAEEIRSVYPDFDWDTELSDRSFVRLIRAGVDGRTAYEVVHRRELLAQAVRYGAQAAREQVSRTLASGGQRVRENGARSLSVMHSDPRGLTSAQLADIRRRVQKGEKIVF